MEEKIRIQDSRFKIQDSELNFLILFILIFSLFTVHLSLVTGVHAATVDDTVNDLQKKFSGINDIKGAFTQTSYLKDLEKTETYAGTFYIRKPSGIMWEYKAPRDEKVIINGTDTWVYKKSQKQAIKTRFSKEAYSQAPIALLNSMENLRADFDISLMGQDSLKLRPKHQVGVIREMVIKTGAKNFPVKTLKVFDMYGNIITIELADTKTNSGLADSLFVFTAPPGVEVFDMSQ
ncbi:MAG: outer membrane lipoprotein carrier protein LolA [Nitrospiraceae bacterium]|nr:MAG: outer membrane lipoprotein carrier protein LolA [Nitrospiraceae bacterium]